MEVVSGRKKAVNLAKKTCINDLPKNMIVHILDRVPIQDAVRTSILCRSWRFHWTFLTNLIFDYECFMSLKSKVQEALLLVNYTKIISRVLLLHWGTVQKFCLWRPEGINHEDIDQWISFLMRKGVKEFTVYGKDSRSYKLPTHFFSFADLTHLELENCLFKATSTLAGFPCLKALELLDIRYESGGGASWKFVAGCPLLEKFLFRGTIFQLNIDNIAKLQNLKKCELSFLCWQPNLIVDIVQCFSSLQKLEEVDLSWEAYYYEGIMRKWVTTVFRSLRVLKLDSINFRCSRECLLVWQIICSSPSLQEFVITSRGGNDPVFEEVPVSYWKEDRMMRQLQLVTLRSFKGLRNELILIKFLLACSPRLEKLSLRFHPDLDQVSQCRNALRISKELMKFHRASNKTQIDFSYE